LSVLHRCRSATFYFVTSIHEEASMRWTIAAAATCLLLNGPSQDITAPGQSPPASDKPATAAAVNNGTLSNSGCLDAPKHWSHRPKFGPGVEVALIRYVRFQTPDERSINAKIFLVEIHPDRAPADASVPPELAERRRSIPARVACHGFEIATDDRFTPDFIVSKRYVTQRSECQYEVNLGSLICNIETTTMAAK
jgi:hypothetical protein